MMNCHICGSDLVGIEKDLPFQIDEATLITIPDVPVLQCPQCGECVLDDASMARIDKILQERSP